MRIRLYCEEDFRRSDGIVLCQGGRYYELRKETHELTWKLIEPSGNPFDEDRVLIEGVSSSAVFDTGCFTEELPF